MNELTQSDLKAWAFAPATHHFIKLLTDKRNSCLEELGNNYHKNSEAIHRAIGICQSLKASIDAIESLKGGEDDK